MISESTLRNTEFEEKLQLFIYDLILISVAKFNRVIILHIFFLCQVHSKLIWKFGIFFVCINSCIPQSCRWRAHLHAHVSKKCGYWFSCWSRDYTITVDSWTHFGATSIQLWIYIESERVIHHIDIKIIQFQTMTASFVQNIFLLKVHMQQWNSHVYRVMLPPFFRTIQLFSQCGFWMELQCWMDIRKMEISVAFSVHESVRIRICWNRYWKRLSLQSPTNNIYALLY